jgi:signal transduction histidine kinase
MAEGLHRAQAEREELHAALARRERLAALGRVVAGVAHEVRNPLAAIKLLADLVREGGPETERTRDLETLGREVDRLDRLVSDLLVFTRTAPRAPVMHDIAALAAERASLLVPWAGLRQISLRTSGSGSARIDVDGTTRALDNLLRNAIEASPTDGLVEVQVITRNQVIEVCVRDNGAGIPEARAAELFEPFFTTKPRGTGLGLALARAVARAHGGDLTFERALGRTQFTMRIADAR